MGKIKYCPCNPKKLYINCCNPFHLGKKRPLHAEELMRARYSAYALGLSDYVIQTTHPLNPEFSLNHTQWQESINQFCSSTNFQKLIILSQEEKKEQAFVTFFAKLEQNKQDSSFTEKSEFRKIQNMWFYYDGSFL